MKMHEMSSCDKCPETNWCVYPCAKYYEEISEHHEKNERDREKREAENELQGGYAK